VRRYLDRLAERRAHERLVERRRARVAAACSPRVGQLDELTELVEWTATRDRSLSQRLALDELLDCFAQRAIDLRALDRAALPARVARAAALTDDLDAIAELVRLATATAIRAAALRVAA
jgi:hypothetical protein